MKRKAFSPVVECQPQPFNKIAFQTYKLPDGSTYTVKYDEVSLILQQNKLLNVLSAEDIRAMLENIGGNSVSTQSLSDEQLLSIVTSRHLQEPCVLKAHMEAALAQYKDGKESYEKALQSFKDGSYQETKDDTKSD